MVHAKHTKLGHSIMDFVGWTTHAMSAGCLVQKIPHAVQTIHAGMCRAISIIFDRQAIGSKFHICEVLQDLHTSKWTASIS
jgi:hypothetical protein